MKVPELAAALSKAARLPLIIFVLYMSAPAGWYLRQHDIEERMPSALRRTQMPDAVRQRLPPLLRYSVVHAPAQQSGALRAAGSVSATVGHAARIELF
jgi:hypothetical protein